MPTFEFNARDDAGALQTGLLDGNSATAVVSELRSRGWMVTGVREKTAAVDAGFGALASLPFMRPRSVQVELSLQQIAVMLRGGLTLLSSLHTVAEQSSSLLMRRVWRAVIDNVQEGKSFSEALEKHSCFPQYVVRLVRVGEQTGVLESVLVRGSQMLRSRREARRDIVTALSYPAIVFIAAMSVTAYMVGYLIPKLGRLLEAMGKQLPPMTQLLVDIANFMHGYGVMILLGLVSTAVAFTAIYHSQQGRFWVDRLALRVPIFGRIFRIAGTTTFAQSLVTLLRSGITVLEALVTVEQMHYNRYMAESVKASRESIMQGRSLADALRERRAFMPLLTTMAAVGEDSGNLDEVMEEVATFHDSQLKALIAQLAAWVTPVVIVVVGGIVGFVYIAFFLALFAVGA